MKDKVFEIIKAAIDELNEELDYDELANVTPATVVDVEAGVSEAFDAELTLADEKAMSSRNSPYRDVAAFTDFVVARLKEQA